jgi:hypothetical protein
MTSPISNRALFWAIFSLCLFAVVANVGQQESGESKTIDHANVATTGITASKEVIHAIDAAILNG